jgi:3-methyl-2-oxobutanoate hydroxymethyltransferase
MSLNKIEGLISKKGREKITMLTCYDYSLAKILDEAGLDIILVGDSLANVILGLDRTRDISFREMFEHTKAVRRAVSNSLVIADMPYVSYQKNRRKALYFAKKFIEEAGADGVKLEWFPACSQVTKRLVKHKIPLMGHIGLTPQTAERLGGFRVQGRDSRSALRLIEQAKLLSDLGVFSIVLECIPARLAKLITKVTKVPTIGIGAGPFCDGQVLVLYDILGFYKKIRPKFVKVYKDLSPLIWEVTRTFIQDVREGRFPQKDNSFSMSEDEFKKVKDTLSKFGNKNL